MPNFLTEIALFSLKGGILCLQPAVLKKQRYFLITRLMLQCSLRSMRGERFVVSLKATIVTTML